MPILINAKIDLAKILGAKVLKKDGRTFIEVTACQLFEGKNGALYLDTTLFPTPGGEFGDYRVTQDLPKARRDAGDRGAILGNGKNREVGGGQGSSQRPATPPAAPQHDQNDEDVPF